MVELSKRTSLFFIVISSIIIVVCGGIAIFVSNFPQPDEGVIIEWDDTYVDVDRILPDITVIAYSDNYWEGDYLYCLAKVGENPDIDYSFLIVMDEEGEITYNKSSSVWFDYLIPLNNTHIFYKHVARARRRNASDAFIWDMEKDIFTVYDEVDLAGIYKEYHCHHEILVLEDVLVTIGREGNHDTILEINRDTGNVIVLWSTELVINEPIANRSIPRDWFHSNDVSLSLDGEAYFFNIRTANSFVKINRTTGETIWMCGQYGNFTLLGKNGEQVDALWYESHIIEEVEPNKFIMFDNDYRNYTRIEHNASVYPDWKRYESNVGGQSRLIEIMVDEENMTAWLSWVYTAPKKYFCAGFGDIDILPNGNYLGSFGQPYHADNLDEGEEPFGAALLEVTREGELVREYRFPLYYTNFRMQFLEHGFP